MFATIRKDRLRLDSRLHTVFILFITFKCDSSGLLSTANLRSHKGSLTLYHAIIAAEKWCLQADFQVGEGTYVRIMLFSVVPGLTSDCFRRVYEAT